MDASRTKHLLTNRLVNCAALVLQCSVEAGVVALVARVLYRLVSSQVQSQNIVTRTYGLWEFAFVYAAAFWIAPTFHVASMICRGVSIPSMVIRCAVAVPSFAIASWMAFSLGSAPRSVWRSLEHIGYFVAVGSKRYATIVSVVFAVAAFIATVRMMVTRDRRTGARPGQLPWRRAYREFRGPWRWAIVDWICVGDEMLRSYAFILSVVFWSCLASIWFAHRTG